MSVSTPWPGRNTWPRRCTRSSSARDTTTNNLDGSLAASIAAGRGFLDFNREQQAQICEDYYDARFGGSPRHGGTLAELEHFVRSLWSVRGAAWPPGWAVMAAGKARAAAGAKGGAGGAKTAGKPRPKAKPKAPDSGGGACPARDNPCSGRAGPLRLRRRLPAMRCTRGGPAARGATAETHTGIPAGTRRRREREARVLGRRLSLIGEPAADAPRPAAAPQRASAPAAGPEATGAKADSAALPRRRPRLRETRAPHPGLTRARRLSRAERRAGEEALGLDLDARPDPYRGRWPMRLAEQAGAFAFTHGNHIVLGGRAERASARRPVAHPRPRVDPCRAAGGPAAASTATAPVAGSTRPPAQAPDSSTPTDAVPVAGRPRRLCRRGREHRRGLRVRRGGWRRGIRRGTSAMPRSTRYARRSTSSRPAFGTS